MVFQQQKKIMLPQACNVHNIRVCVHFANIPND